MGSRGFSRYAPHQASPDRAPGQGSQAAANGQLAYAALANNATQNAGSGLGPATSIGLSFPGVQSVASGKYVVGGFMDVTGTAGDPVTFTMKLQQNGGGHPVLTLATVVATVDAVNLHAQADFSGIITPAAIGSYTLSMTATAAHALSSAAGNQSLAYFELPA